MQKLDGKIVAEACRKQIKSKAEQFQRQNGRPVGLAVCIVGEDPASQVYVANKLKACEEVGFYSVEKKLPASISVSELKKIITDLNQDNKIDGILVQLPLPKSLSSKEVLNWVAPEKDADCLTAANLGRLWSGEPWSIPCTPYGVMKILEHYKIQAAGKRAVVVGRSNIVGKPMAHLLTEANATVTVCHSKTPNTREHTSQADIVVVAAGQPRFLGKEDFKKGSVVIDVGMHRSNENGKTKLFGDVRFEELEGHVSAATPVPGGVGPMTITMLLENTLRLAELKIRGNK